MTSIQREFTRETIATVNEVLSNEHYEYRIYENKKGETVFEYRRIDGFGGGVIVCDFEELANEVKSLVNPKSEIEKLSDLFVEILPNKFDEYAYGIIVCPDGKERYIYVTKGHADFKYWSVKNGKKTGRIFGGIFKGNVRPWALEFLNEK